MNDVMIRELTETFQALGRNTGCRVIILTGSEKAFSSGMDIEYLHQLSSKTHEENVEDAHNLVQAPHGNLYI